MSAVPRSRGGRPDPMQKRIPENPKYKHIESTVDTGSSLTTYLRKMEDNKTNYKFKPNELFRRMKISTFAQLAIQVHRVDDILPLSDIPVTPAGSELTSRSEMVDQELQHLGHGDSPVPSVSATERSYGTKSELDTQRSNLQSVIQGVGEIDINQPEPQERKSDDSCPYLLLDVRDEDAYARCHIITAVSYPKAFLSRASNYESKKMLQYKNKEGKIIIVYDEDERLVHEAATTLVQRGYDNLFVLSGGLKVAFKKFQSGLLTGTPPDSLLPKKSVHPRQASQREFTEDDIDSLEIHLDQCLKDNSIGSRMSKASTTSSRMSKVSNTSRSTTAASLVPAHLQDRPAFK